MEKKAVRYSPVCNGVHRVQQDLCQSPRMQAHQADEVPLIGSDPSIFCCVLPQQLLADVRAMHVQTFLATNHCISLPVVMCYIVSTASKAVTNVSCSHGY